MKVTLRILIVEDSEDDALLNLIQIKKGGYDIYYERVETAETFIAAINLKNWDIILADYALPHFSGLKALMILKESGKDIPFIIISGIIGEDVAVEAMKSGAHDYVMKNNLHRLLPAVERELYESAERTEKRAIEKKQKQVEENLQASEERFRTLYENVKIGLYRAAPDGTFLMANRALLSMLGFSSFDELTKMKFERKGFQLLSSRKAFYEAIEKDGEVENFESTWIRQDRSPVYVRESARAIRDTNGKTLFYDGTVEDITERKRAREALLKSEERYRLLFETSADGIVIIDVEYMTFKYVNPALCRMLGYTQKELLAMDISGIHPKQDLKWIIAEFEYQDREDKSIASDIPCLRKDGSIFYADINTAKTQFDGRECIISTFRDITGRKQVEDKLRNSEERLKILFDYAPDAYYLNDLKGNFIDGNIAAEKLLGIDKNVFLGKSFLKLHLLSPNQKVKAAKLLTRNMLGQSTGPDEFVLLRKDSSAVTVEISTHPIKIKERAVVLGIARDITRRKQAEKDLKDSEARARGLVDAIPDTIFRLNKQGVYVDYKADKKDLAFIKESVIGKNIREVMPPEFTDLVDKKMKQTLKTRQMQVFDYQLPWPNNGFSEFEARMVPVSPDEVIVIIRDVTERRQSEQALQNSELRFKQVSENAQEWIWEVDKNGLYTYSNPFVNDLLGYRPEEIIGKKHFYDLFDPENREEMKKVAFEGFARKDSFRNFINDCIHKDGRKVILSTSGVPMLDSENNLVGYRGIDIDITERVHAEQLLKSSEERYRSVTQSANEAIITSDSKGTIIDWNRGAEKIFGYTETEAKGQNLSVIIPQAYKKEHDRGIKRMEKESESHVIGTTVELQGIHKSGKEFPLELSLAQWESSEGKFFTGIIRDITERKHTEEALRYEKKLLRLLIDNIPDLMYTKDTACRKTLVNIADVQNMGVKSESEVLGKDDFAFFSKELAKKFFADDLSVIQTGQPMINKEEYTINEKGQEKWLLTSKFPLKDERGQIIGLAGVGRDITERKRTIEALQNSELRFKQVSENAREWIWEVDENGLFTYVNPVVKEILDYIPEEVVGKKHFYDFYKQEEKEKIKQLLFELFSSKKSFKDIISTYVHKDDREVILSTSGVPILENEEKLLGYRGVNVDITERIRAEEEIRLKNEQLLKVNAEKDRFFSIIAHDLRGPFSSYIGFTKLLVDELPNLPMDKIKSYALKLRDSAVNIFYLLENLLEWANMQRGLLPFKPEVFQLYPLIEDCLVTLKDPAQKKKIEITTDIPDQLKVLADSNMLKSVIRNLVSNAVKFTPHEGKINLSARTSDHQNIEIAIKDTGIGMNKTMVDDLFRIDARTNRSGTDNEPSSGLGLVLCKEFIEKHSGKIWVKSEEKDPSTGKAGGTTFNFVIPQRIPEQAK